MSVRAPSVDKSDILSEKLKVPENQQNQILNILDNTFNSFLFDEKQCFLVVKSYYDKKYSMIILTDFDSQFWMEQIDYQFLVKMRRDMRLQSSLISLAEHLSNGLSKKVSIRSLGKVAKLKVPFEIGGHDGLLFNATLTLRVRINEEQNFPEHLKLLKFFFRHYSLAQQTQIKKIKLNPILPLITAASQTNDRKPKPLQPKQAPTELHAKQKIRQGRDLINPLRQKRRPIGMKLSKKPSQDRSGSSSDSDS